jgi:hypothetical protein
MEYASGLVNVISKSCLSLRGFANTPQLELQAIGANDFCLLVNPLVARCKKELLHRNVSFSASKEIS